MKSTFFLLSLVASCMTINAQSLTPAQTENLFKTGQLWGHLTYFHPYMQYKKIEFDSAYAAAVPKIMAAQSDKEVTTALNEWLSILNDPITLSEVKPTSEKTEQKFEANFQNKAGIGILTMSGSLTDWNAVANKLSTFTDSLETLKGFVLDCRQMTENFSWFLEYSGLQEQLFSKTISTLGERTVSHSGFIPEMGSSSGGYQTYFRNYAPKTLTGQLKKDIPVVFVVSAQTVVPDVAWAMRKAGKAAIISNEPLADKQNAVSYPFTEGVVVHFRLYESLTSHTMADEIHDDKEDNALINKALDIIQNNKFNAQTVVSNLSLEMREKKPNYARDKFPTIGYRALAAAKINYIINHFYPNKKLMSANWDSVTRAYIPSIVLAKDSAEYQFAISAFYAYIQDGHGFMGGSLITKLINGGYERAPINGEMVEGKFVVNRFIDDSLATALGFQKGDIVLKRNGKDISEIINNLKTYRAYSNDVTGTKYVAYSICSGAENTEGVFTIQKRDNKIVDIKVPFNKKMTNLFNKDRAGKANTTVLRFLTPDIGYADLDRLAAEEVDSMFDMFKNTKAIVFDMRGYPQGTAWTIAPRLTEKKYVIAAKFTRLETDQPQISTENSEVGSSETWTTFTQKIPSPVAGKSTYKGKTVMLINENTQSQAEHTGLFFRAANGTKFIGSQTAGANGDVTDFTIPGGLTLNFSGQTVWFPDGTQLQKVGLKPDVFIRPTIKGVQLGKDEVLERAIQYLQTGK